MRHDFFDRTGYSHNFGRVPQRTKLAAALVLVALIAAIPNGWFAFLLVATFTVAALVMVSGLPLALILKRAGAVVPFILVITFFVPFFKEGETIWAGRIAFFEANISSEGLIIFASVVWRAVLAVTVLIVLSATARFNEILAALSAMRAPKIFISILSFMYRYIFLLQDEFERLGRAKEARTANFRWLSEIKTRANIVGILFIRAFERSERVYDSMCARGFTGEIVTLDERSGER